MSLSSVISDEIKRSPITAISGAAAVVIAALSLGLAWIQYRGAAPVTLPPTTAASSSPAGVSVGNVLLLISYFLAVTVSASLLLRIIARKHDITAMFVSIPLVALTNFTVILLIFLAPPRPMTSQLFTSAHDLVFYASAAVMIAFCGKAVIADLASTTFTKKSDSESKVTEGNSDGMAVLFLALFLLAIWSWLVFAGQTRLTRTLLPEIAHPAEVKSSAEAPNSTVERDAPKAARPSP